MPYATGLVSASSDSRPAQAFCRLLVIANTVCNPILRKVIDKPNAGSKKLLSVSGDYRRLLVPDILIKVIALVISLAAYPPAMMYGALAAGTYMQPKPSCSEKGACSSQAYNRPGRGGTVSTASAGTGENEHGGTQADHGGKLP